MQPNFNLPTYVIQRLENDGIPLHFSDDPNTMPFPAEEAKHAQ
jgi:hypothetical protein